MKYGKVFRTLGREVASEFCASHCCWVEKTWRVYVLGTTSNCIQLQWTEPGFPAGLIEALVRHLFESRWQCGGQGFEPPQLHSFTFHLIRPLTCVNRVGGRSCFSVPNGQCARDLEQIWSSMINTAKCGHRVCSRRWVSWRPDLVLPLGRWRRRAWLSGVGSVDGRSCHSGGVGVARSVRMVRR